MAAPPRYRAPRIGYNAITAIQTITHVLLKTVG
jgi:hypothetical protein